jgi:hypothetical protein
VGPGVKALVFSLMVSSAPWEGCMSEFGRFLPESRKEAREAYDAWEAWALAHDPPFHLQDVLKDLISVAKEKDTLPYGYFRTRYGLARGSSISRKERVGSGVGWVVGVVAKIFALQHRTSIQLSSLVVDKSTKVNGDPGYPGDGFDYQSDTPVSRRAEARRAQREVWAYFSRLKGSKFAAVRNEPSHADDRGDKMLTTGLLERLRRHKAAPNKWGSARIRLGQDRFREVVLENFGHRCAVCGVNMDALLEAAHLRTWSERPNERLDPANGVALCSFHHTAQERHLLKISGRGRIEIAPEVRVNRNAIVQGLLARYTGKSVSRPKWPVHYA